MTVKASPAPVAFLDLGAIWRDTIGWFTTHANEVLIGVAAGVILVSALLLIQAGLQKLIDRLDPVGRQETHWITVASKLLRATKFWFFVVLAIQIVISSSNIGAAVKTLVNVTFGIGITIQAALWVRTLVLGIIRARMDEDGENSRLSNAFGVIKVLVSVLIFGIGFIVVLDNLGVNVTALVAGLGIGGIAIGLAAQGIFSDLFSALAILLDKPFQRGDVITFDQTTGTVETIGLKTTRLRAITGELVIIANSQLLDKRLGNYSNIGYRRVDLAFGVIYQTSPYKLRAIPELVRAIVEATDKCRLLRCAMIGFGPSDLQYQLQFDVDSTDLDAMYQARQSVCLAILECFAREGIAFAYPTQTTFTAAPDGKMIMPFAELSPGPRKTVRSKTG